MNSRLASIIRKEFIQIFRDTRTLMMIIVIPIMQLFLLGIPPPTTCATSRWQCWIGAAAPNRGRCLIPTARLIISGSRTRSSLKRRSRR
jgi:hypothetical protein